MTVRPRFDNVGDWLAAKPQGHFVVERWGRGTAITIHRVGCAVETILCESPGEANRIRQSLSDEGLCGYVAGGVA
ncbi:hypothetical protein NYR54_17450 [Chelativorans sp. SCAU2101]|uniref:Uncharacterized protein n=1 Tax=Chelativorans petroleitrophicus TaxID=2975484 RepID=A0A9X2XAQ0_9HYPH|nr:hypothetical protein [Chelativorans petroleitrophicus]MCT8992050.1 hypothetical protein [Chelativorans petroleitrophicus]